MGKNNLLLTFPKTLFSSYLQDSKTKQCAKNVMHQHGHILIIAQNQISKFQLQVSEKNHLLINTLSYV